MAVTAGYDVGGAHLKVALVEDGRVIAVEQIPCPLWQGLDRLDSGLRPGRPIDRPRRATRSDDDGRAVRDLPRPQGGRDDAG